MRKLTIICVSAVALAVPSSAMAGNVIRHEGQIVRDDATLVKLRVEMRSGEPRKIAGFRAKNVRVNCKNGQKRITFTALTPIRVKRDNRFEVRLSDGEGGYLKIKGQVRNKGRATVGSLRTSEFKSEGTTCQAPKQRFKTRKA